MQSPRIILIAFFVTVCFRSAENYVAQTGVGTTEDLERELENATKERIILFFTTIDENNQADKSMRSFFDGLSGLSITHSTNIKVIHVDVRNLKKLEGTIMHYEVKVKSCPALMFIRFGIKGPLIYGFDYDSIISEIKKLTK